MNIILLHGLGQNSRSWIDTVQTMNRNNKFDVLCPDLTCWIQDDNPCYSALYKALENYCDPFDEPLCLCGLSLGGSLAMQYAIEHPDKVHAVALIGTQFAMPKLLLRLQNIIFHIMPGSAFSDMGFQKAHFISLCKSMIELDFTRDLSKIRCSTLILCGDKDKANKPASLRLAELIPNAEAAMIPHAGHEVNMDNPVRLGQELNRFFLEYKI